MTRSALLNIDTQCSFFQRDFWEDSHFADFSRNMNTLISGCTERQIPVVDIFHVDESGPFSIKSGFVTPMPFLTHKPAATFHKHVHNAFTDTGLDNWLRRQNIGHVIICGMRTEQCCETTARVASDLGYQVTFVSEATLTFAMTWQGVTLDSDALHHRTETVLTGRFATISTVEQCLAGLTRQE